MTIIQASKPATCHIDDQLMIIIFQQYLKSVTFNEPRMYRIEGRERVYLFHTTPAHYGWELTYNINSEDINNCNDIQTLITLAEFINARR